MAGIQIKILDQVIVAVWLMEYAKWMFNRCQWSTQNVLGIYLVLTS